MVALAAQGVMQAVKPVALLQHGLLCSCAEFLYQGPGKSLAQILADAGEQGQLSPGCAAHTWPVYGMQPLPAVMHHPLLSPAATSVARAALPVIAQVLPCHGPASQLPAGLAA
jgi:hypothetical protein